uniref:Uncharacterized protein n=1 Tax=Plectus sambesii TaxID=2011161 RepID=A0A914WK14_9BILA
MTVESLLSEVKMVPHLAQQQRLKAGDEAYFGGKLLYHETAPGPSSEGHDGQGHGNGHDHGQRGQQHAPHHRGGIAQAIAETREKVSQALHSAGGHGDGKKGGHGGDSELKTEVAALRKDNTKLHSDLADLKSIVEQLQASISQLGGAKVCAKPAQPAAQQAEAKDDEDIDLFGSSDEEVDEEKERIKQERLKAYAEKKSKKPGPIAKSSVILDVKPWDDETDLGEMEKLVRSIEKDGLVWGGGKLIPLAYGIKKLQIICVIEDDKVSVDDLIESITEGFSDHVQSVDIAAFNKI